FSKVRAVLSAEMRELTAHVDRVRADGNRRHKLTGGEMRIPQIGLSAIVFNQSDSRTRLATDVGEAASHIKSIASQSQCLDAEVSAWIPSRRDAGRQINGGKTRTVHAAKADKIAGQQY